MKFATEKEHRSFFEKMGWIECEGIVTLAQSQEIKAAIDKAQAARLGIAPSQLSSTSLEKRFKEGFDLWRESDELKKIVLQIKLAQLASTLLDKKNIRMGYDLFFPPFTAHRFVAEKGEGNSYADFLSRSTTLQEVSCIDEILCGLFIALDDSEEGAREEADIFPIKTGHLLVLRPSTLIPWHFLKERQKQRFYLIVYTGRRALYRLQEEDPHTHAFKRLGYIFNDKLIDLHHPMIYR